MSMRWTKFRIRVGTRIIDASRLHLAKDAETEDEAGRKRAFTSDDLTKLLEHAARMNDGRYRAMASKMIRGKLKGPFPHVGFRKDLSRLTALTLFLR